MKTLIIYNPVVSELEYYIFDGDLTKFNRLVINGVTDDYKLLEEFENLLWDSEGNRIIEKQTNKDLLDNKEWDLTAVVTELS